MANPPCPSESLRQFLVLHMLSKHLGRHPSFLFFLTIFEPFFSQQTPPRPPTYTPTMMVTQSKLSLLCLLASLIVSFSVGGEGTGLRGEGAMLGPHDELLNVVPDNNDRQLKKKRIKEASNRASLSGTTLGGITTSSSSFETGCIKADNRTYNLTADEANNGKWMNEARNASKLKPLLFAADLVVEAQRWAKYLASRQTVKTRDYLNRNLFCGISTKLGEYVISNKSVNKTGAFTSMMNGGGRAYILYSPYDRYGIGIAKNGTFYYMVTLFRTRA
jgi:Cysteine-rich secretory protein family